MGPELRRRDERAKCDREDQMRKLLFAASAVALGLTLAGGARAASVKIAFTIHSSTANTFWQAVIYPSHQQ